MILGYLYKPDFDYPGSWRVMMRTAVGFEELTIAYPERISGALKDAKEPILVSFLHIHKPKRAMNLEATEETVDWEFEMVNNSGSPNTQPANMDQRAKAFHNPYNFIPAPEPCLTGPLGQGFPAGHHVFKSDLNSGWIDITLKTITPLLLADAAKVPQDDDHKTYDTRCETRNGKQYPLFPVTSFKGGLRSAYEAVTNSRFGIFREHDDRLATRQAVSVGAARIPARVGRDPETNELCLELFLTRTNQQPKANNAWLPVYGHRGATQMVCPPPSVAGGKLDKYHGTQVTCEIQENTRQKQTRYGKRSSLTFNEVVKLTLKNVDEYGTGSGYVSEDQTFIEKTAMSIYPVSQMPIIDVWGYICINHRNFNGKHDERVFWMPAGQQPESVELTEEHEQSWKTLIANYKEEHERSGSNSPSPVHSRHLAEHNSETLSEGSLLYVDTKKSVIGNAVIRPSDITGLYPVLVSRELQSASPSSLLPENLHPNREMKTSSPADRVFGWANPAGDGGYRGQVQIDPLVCRTEPDCALETFGNDGLPLAILGEPKPKQARFYAAKDVSGVAMEDGLDGKDGRENSLMAYKPGAGLRGRKVYPHHHSITDAIDTYWNANEALNDAKKADWVNSKGPIREYVKVPERNNNPSRSSQNRSIRSWVKPLTEFTTRVRFSNLNHAELGALIYLLNGEDAYLRMGGAKPLGFGSMSSQITGFSVELGHKISERLKIAPFSLSPEPSDENRKVWLDEYIDQYTHAIKTAYEKAEFADVSFIAAWKAMNVQNPDFPHAYPRIEKAPRANGENFRWFVANNKGNNNTVRAFTLPDLASGKGLPRF